MSLLNLPDDIIYNIIDKCTIGKQRQITIINQSLNSDEICKKIKDNVVIKILRIKLWLKICIQKQKLFRDINYILNRHFTLNFCGMMRYKDICLLYAPHVQYGPCRFCMKNLNEHKYFKMMNIYLELNTKSTN